MAIDIALQPKQSELLELVRNSDYTMIGYGGSNGGGKSDGIRGVWGSDQVENFHQFIR